MGPWAMEPVEFSGYFARVKAAIENGELRAPEARRVDHPARQSVDNALFEDRAGIRTIAVNGPLTKHVHKFEGVIGGTSMSAARQLIEEARTNDEIEGVMLHVDSPGGSVAGTGDLGDAISALSQEKPVFSFIEDLGASAAYWLASQSTKVFASRHAEVGSIGVLAQVFDTQEFFRDHGVKAMVVSTGDRKGDFAEGVEVTPDMLEELERRLIDSHNLFVSAVAGARGLQTENDGGKLELLSPESRVVSDGRVFIADDPEDTGRLSALEMGLIDEVSTDGEALSALRTRIHASTLGRRAHSRGSSARTAGERSYHDDEDDEDDGEETMTDSSQAPASEGNTNEGFTIIDRQGNEIGDFRTLTLGVKVDGEDLPEAEVEDLEEDPEASDDKDQRSVREEVMVRIDESLPGDAIMERSESWKMWAEEGSQSALLDALTSCRDTHKPEASLLRFASDADLVGYLSEHASSVLDSLIEDDDSAADGVSDPSSTGRLKDETDEPSTGGVMTKDELKAALDLDDEGVEALLQASEDGRLSADTIASLAEEGNGEPDATEDGQAGNREEETPKGSEGDADDDQPSGDEGLGVGASRLMLDALNRIEGKVDDQGERIEAIDKRVEGIETDRQRSTQQTMEDKASELSLTYGIERDELLEQTDSKEGMERLAKMLRKAQAGRVNAHKRKQEQEAEQGVPNVLEEADAYHEQRLAEGKHLRIGTAGYTSGRVS